MEKRRVCANEGAFYGVSKGQAIMLHPLRCDRESRTARDTIPASSPIAVQDNPMPILPKLKSETTPPLPIDVVLLLLALPTKQI